MKKSIEQALVPIIGYALKELGFEEILSKDLFSFALQYGIDGRASQNNSAKQHRIIPLDLRSRIGLDFPTDTRFGDLSTNIALRCGRRMKRPSLEIALALVAAIKKHLEKSAIKDYIKEIKAEGAGFINFYLADKYFHQQLKELVTKKKKALKMDVDKGKRVLIEFVSANPTGPLSVAHARQAVVGDCLANILEFLRFKVKREFYLNDEGNQINILGKSIELRLRELKGEKIEFPENYYQGDYIYDIAKKISVTKFNGDFSDYGVKYILKLIKKELDDFGVRFDYWYSQKALRKSGKIKSALNLLKEKGLLYEQDGAWWFKSTQFQDDKDRVVIKSDGDYTYLAPDIAYHREKYKRGFDWLVNLWGPDHHGYISRLKASIEALGYPRGSLSIVIVQLASIFKEGRVIEMSTRRGQYITLREVLNEVGVDASRFFFTMRRTSSHLDFDLELAKKQTLENPVYYIQYAYARLSSIIRNYPGSIKLAQVNFNLLQEKEELALIKKLWQFSYILNICLQTQDPYMLTVYLQELAEHFHKFYDLHRVLGEDKSLTASRMALIKGTQIIIATGLGLLGVSKPEKM